MQGTTYKDGITSWAGIYMLFLALLVYLWKPNLSNILCEIIFQDFMYIVLPQLKLLPQFQIKPINKTHLGAFTEVYIINSDIYCPIRKD